MRCRACCCKSRTGIILGGTFNLILGLIAIAYFCYILTHNRINKYELDENSKDYSLKEKWSDEEFWAEFIALGFPAITLTSLGIMTILAAKMHSSCLATTSFLLNILIILGCFVLFIIMFICGIHWIDIIPLLGIALIEIYFVFVIQDYRNTDLKLDSV